MRALGRLLRLSLAPSAVADVAAGTVAAAGAWPAGPAPFLLIGASLGLYHGGMALNDWADRAVDARARPERPLPSGALRPALALLVAGALLAGGVALAWSVSRPTGLTALAIAAVVLAYDLGPRGALLGPLCLALARAGNLGLGMLLGLGEAKSGMGLAPAALGTAALCYGLYVLVVSRLGRLEDAPEPPPPGLARRLLSGAALLLAGAPALTLATHGLAAGLQPRHLAGGAAATLAALLAARGLARAARADPRAPGELVHAMGLALRRLLILTTTLALASATPAAVAVAALLFAGYPLSHALRRAFPPS